ncbi:acyl-CoA dehydrogenase [Cryptosporangium aurantiacum]|uniref:Acyl-coenzyme A oxidase n=1 Tax=Cryptosporangium aurantiacum TaxID=134849 RepID=A0A1M7NKQ9_9ACTN|nr:acyl-CoA dehydrogenase [Cryptosporangium aurantiacum]SHN04558.1 Acyl-coenzyme A oxidase [Cryptosporangium aurantiacum]
MSDTAVDQPELSELRRVFDGRWGRIREEARQALRRPEFGLAADLDRDAHRQHVWEQLQQLAKVGHSRLGFPTRYGGEGDTGGSVVSFEMLGYGDLSLMVKSGVQWGLFGGAIQALGTDRHHERYLPAVMSLDLPGCFAMTETGHGSDVQHLRTIATYDPETREFVVETPHEAARKDYIGGAARDARLAVVFAQLITQGESHGVHAFLVPIRDDAGNPCPGVRIGDCGGKAGLSGVDNGRLWFDRVRIPRENLLNRYGDVAEDGTYSSPIENSSRRFFTMLGTLVRGRVSVAGGAGSATQTALAIAVRYGEVRRQFAAPGRDREVALLDYLAHQRALLPALAKTYALRFAQEELVTTLHELQPADGLATAASPAGVQHGADGPRPSVDTGSGDARDDGEAAERRQRELEARAAGLKAIATWHASATIQACREACGGAGYLTENRLPQLRADTDVFTTFEGDNRVLLQLVAKGLLTGYRDQVGDLDALGMVRFFADQVWEAVAERTSARNLLDRLRRVAPGRDEEGDLRDREWHLALFEDREKHVLDGLARRLRKAGEPDADAFAVFNDAQDHVLRLARVHVEQVLLEAFTGAVDRVEDPDTRALLDRVCSLFALSTIEADLAWFLGHGRMTPGRAKRVTAAVNELCQELRPHALTLVEAFGIPEDWLDAPIAQGAEEQRQDTMHAFDTGAPETRAEARRAG